MHSSGKLKREFIKKWIKGLQICYSSQRKMDVMERKKKIKLCADIALASAKNAPTSWSNALISDAKKDGENKILVNNIVGCSSKSWDVEPVQKTTMISRQQMVITSHLKRVRSTKILKKSRTSVSQRIKKMGPPPNNKSNLAIYVAKRLVKKRTQVLKTLVPGGESMDEVSLIKEALDYILSLKVQVDVMRSVVANAIETTSFDQSS